MSLPTTFFRLILGYLTRARLAKQAADDRKAHFKEILIAWDEENKKQDKKRLRGRKHEALCKVRANISEKHTWDEVLAELQKLKEEANNATGLGSKVRKFLGRVADNNDMIMPLIDFIPNGDYGSVLCGGLKFILGVGLQSQTSILGLTRSVRLALPQSGHETKL
jgi:hypothetical protein